MTETTAQPLTREDITAAVIEALEAATVRAINKPTECTINYNISCDAGSEEVARKVKSEKVDDPRISARYDRPLNMIAISIDGEDDVYLPRDGAFTFSDEIAEALKVQAKHGGAA